MAGGLIDILEEIPVYRKQILHHVVPQSLHSPRYALVHTWLPMTL